jgi:hypothetical protein
MFLTKKIWFCPDKVTELPDLTVFTLQIDPRLHNCDKIHIEHLKCYFCLFKR